MKNLLFPLFLLLLISSSTFCQNKKVIAENEIFKTAQENIEKYRKADFTIQLKGIERTDFKDLTIEVEQVSHDFLFGCIIFDLVTPRKTPENIEEFKRLFKNIFNFAVFPFYWSGYEPSPGKTKQQEIMEVVKWCNKNGITTKGHPLVWTHEAGTPKWLSNYSTAESKVLLEKRVKKIVSEFKGEIDIWDVINEVIHTVNWDMAMKENKAGKNKRYTGKDLMMEKVDFIDSCFQWAHKANPDAHLIINEFNIVANEDSRQEFYNTVEKLLQQKTPISGLGIQVHEPFQGKYYYSPQQIWETYETYAEFNLPLHVTEFIPVSNGDSIKGIYKTGVWTEQVQADFAEMIFRLSFGHPALKSINWWGFTDKHIWQEGGGLLDKNLHPKLVYKTLDRLINKEWKTQISNLKPNKSGEIFFRGFKGDYKIKVKQEGKLVKEALLKSSDSKQKFIIQLL